MACGVGVEAVGKVEVTQAGDSVEQERHEVEPAGGGETRVDVGEASRIGRAVRRVRNAHAHEDDARTRALAAFDDHGQVTLRLVEGLATQSVVDAESHDQHVGLFREHSGEASQALGHRVAAHARVVDANPPASLAQGPPDPGGIGFSLREPPTGGQAVAEERDQGAGLGFLATAGDERRRQAQERAADHIRTTIFPKCPWPAMWSNAARASAKGKTRSTTGRS